MQIPRAMPKRGTGRRGRKRTAEDASGESGSAGGGTTAATKKSAPGRGSSTVAGKDADGNASLKADHRNLAQGDPTRAVRTATSYFDAGWNEYARKKDGTLEWAPEMIVGIAQDFHKMIDDGNSKTTLYKCDGKGTRAEMTPGSPSHIWKGLLAWSKISKIHTRRQWRGWLRRRSVMMMQNVKQRKSCRMLQSTLWRW